MGGSEIHLHIILGLIVWDSLCLLDGGRIYLFENIISQNSFYLNIHVDDDEQCFLLVCLSVYVWSISTVFNLSYPNCDCE